MKAITSEYYGDNTRWFVGRCIENVPPAGLEGRIKVRIFGIHSGNVNDIPQKDLPWAQVLIPTTEGGVSGYGRIPQILAGSFVFGCFLDGKSSQIPLIMGSLPRLEFPTNVQLGKTGTVETNARLQNSVQNPLAQDDIAETSIQLRRQQCMKFFLDNGYNLIHSAAITGALQGVSRFLTFHEEETPQIGIVSWERSDNIGSRFNGLLAFSQQFQPTSDWRLFSIQLSYVLFELRNRYSSVNRKLLNTTDIETASEIVNRNYVITTNNTEILAQTAYDEAFE